MATTSKKNLIDRVAESTACTHVQVKRIVQEFFVQVTVELTKGNRLEFRDFGVFETRTSATRTTQNPKTLEKVRVSIRSVPSCEQANVQQRRVPI